MLATLPAFAADPAPMQIGDAQQALERARAAAPQGPAADMLAEAEQRLVQAQAALAGRHSREAVRLASESEAAADLALARARFDRARMEIERKTLRNAELRRRLLAPPAGSEQ